jgi:hypothetical protein
VPISAHILAFPWRHLKARFTGRTVFDASDVLALVKDGWEHPTATEEARACGANTRFRTVVEQAFSFGPDDEAAPGVIGFSFAELGELLQFVAARSHLDNSPLFIVYTNESTKPVSWAKASSSTSGKVTNYPCGECLKSHTCFSTLDLIYVPDCDETWCAANVILNIRHTLQLGGSKSQFADSP